VQSIDLHSKATRVGSSQISVVNATVIHPD